MHIRDNFIRIFTKNSKSGYILLFTGMIFLFEIQVRNYLFTYIFKALFFTNFFRTGNRRLNSVKSYLI